MNIRKVHPQAARRRPVLTVLTASGLVAALGTAAVGHQPLRDAAPSPTAAAGDATSCGDRAAAIVAGMTDRQRVGQLLMGTPTVPAAAVADQGTRAQIQEYGIGSFITQGTSAKTPEGAAAYHNQLQTWAEQAGSGVPLFLGMDLENGTAQQILTATGHPYPMGLGAAGDLPMTGRAAEVAGQEAAAIGVNWSFGPVADLNTNPANPVIGVRSFGADTDPVSRHAATYAAGLHRAGVLSAVKHFPGHGDTSVDSHTGLPTVTFDRTTLERHLAPFREAFRAGAAGAMTAHVVIEAVDPKLPATLSPAVLTGLLRGELRFDGIIITDSMDMAAITSRYGRDEALVRAIGAGADVAMVAGDARHASDVLVAALTSGALPSARVVESARRVVRVKCEQGLWERRQQDPAAAFATVGTAAAHAQAVEQARRGMTLVATDGSSFPLRRDHRVLVTGAQAGRVADQLRSLGATAVTTLEAPTGSPSAAERAAAAAAARGHDRVVVTTFTSGAPNQAQAGLVADVAATGVPTVAVSLGLPYDLAGLGAADARVAAYALNVNRVGSAEVFTGLAAVLLGDRRATGRLPVPVGPYPIGHGLG